MHLLNEPYIVSIRTHLLEMQKRAGDSLEFIENVKIDLFPDEVYVFTPQGDVKAFPKGATPIDFAYSIHTDVGNLRALPSIGSF